MHVPEVLRYSLLHVECHSISISNLNLPGLFSTERSKRDLEDQIFDWDLTMKKWHSECNRLYVTSACVILRYVPYACVISTSNNSKPSKRKSTDTFISGPCLTHTRDMTHSSIGVLHVYLKQQQTQQKNIQRCISYQLLLLPIRQRLRLGRWHHFGVPRTRRQHCSLFAEIAKVVENPSAMQKAEGIVVERA